MPESVIRFKNVTLGYGNKTVLRGLDFSINQNDFLGIVGSNGSGKTTILKGILGLIKPRGGAIEKRESLACGYVPQSNTLDGIFPFTVYEIVKMQFYGSASIFRARAKRDTDRIHSVLTHTGIDAYASIPYRNLSGGLKQRVLIARALVTEPDVLVLDEPTNDLDISSEKSIMDLIKDARSARGMTVIIVSHLINNIINYADTIGFIDTDTFRIHPMDTVLNETELWKTYHAGVHIGSVRGRKVIVAE